MQTAPYSSRASLFVFGRDGVIGRASTVGFGSGTNVGRYLGRGLVSCSGYCVHDEAPRFVVWARYWHVIALALQSQLGARLPFGRDQRLDLAARWAKVITYLRATDTLQDIEDFA